MAQKKAKDYRVSIVTPFHNVDMDFFRRAYASLKEQTIGFESIEWIVVLHNTSPEYHEAVHKLLDEYENVVLKRLDNSARTPSSPRNYGMRFATAPYLGFLDGDDSYTPKCLQTAIRHLMGTASQMVVFRREYQLEHEGLYPMTEIVLWNQTQEEIVIDREHWDNEKMFSGVWGMVTSRLYDRAFLAKHSIAFDEEVLYLEDVLFLVEAYGKIRRVCYLPQFIGYRYFINGGSLVQSVSGKPGAELVAYAKGFRKIFEAFFRNGIYVDWFMASILTIHAQNMVQAQHLTLAERQEIKEILEPYVHRIRMLPVNKLTTESQAKMFYELPREVILHPENFDRGAHIQRVWNGQDVLEEILRKNQGTDYSIRYHFDVLRSAEGYQARVPLSHYDTYAPLVELQTKVGESGIFVADPVDCYLLSSGSMGMPRLIPATKKHLEPYLEEFMKLVRGKTTFLMMESLPMREHYNDQAVLNSISGMVLSSFLRRERDTMQGTKARFTSPELLLCPPEAMDTLYLRLLFALKERDVEQIVAPFAWGIVEALSFMEDHWEDMVSDIEKGQVTFALDVPDSFLRQLGGLLNKDPERAEELRCVFREGFETPILPRIWPKLQRTVADGTGSFLIYAKRMKRYTGDIPHTNGFAVSSEALLGKALDDTEDYELIPGLNFYEFLPFPAEEEDAPLLLSQTKAGSDYELIVTNHAGLYRYCTGNIIRVKECQNGRLVFTPQGRQHELVRLGDAMLGEKEIYEAIGHAAQTHGTAIADFAFFVPQDADEERLMVLLEPEEGPGTGIPKGTSLCVAGCAALVPIEKLAATLDEALCRENAGYAEARRAGLPPCSLRWIQPQTQLLYRDVQRFRKKTAPDQIRPTHFLNTPAKVKFFMRNIEPGRQMQKPSPNKCRQQM